MTVFPVWAFIAVAYDDTGALHRLPPGAGRKRDMVSHFSHLQHCGSYIALEAFIRLITSPHKPGVWHCLTGPRLASLKEAITLRNSEKNSLIFSMRLLCNLSKDCCYAITSFRATLFTKIAIVSQADGVAYQVCSDPPISGCNVQSDCVEFASEI